MSKTNEDIHYFWTVFKALRKQGRRSLKPLEIFIAAARSKGHAPAFDANRDKKQFEKAGNRKDEQYRLPKYVKDYLAICEADLAAKRKPKGDSIQEPVSRKPQVFRVPYQTVTTR